jgi:hypothetical protein
MAQVRQGDLGIFSITVYAEKPTEKADSAKKSGS